MPRSVEIARAFVTLEANTKGLDQQLTQAEKSLGRTAKFVLAHPVAAFGAAGVALVALGAKATSMAAIFEKSMAEVGTQVDRTAVDMSKLSEGVLDIFKSLPIATLDELTAGLYNVVSAGIPASQAIDFLRISAEASVAGVTDVNTAVHGLTTVVNAFATQGLTAADAADSFFTAAKLGKTSFGELAASVGNVAALANNLGVSLDDLLANTTALTNSGISTSEAFNAIRAVMSNVVKPTAELRRDFPELAKNFDVAALKSKGLTGFLTDLAKELQGNTTQASKMFGRVEALNAVLALTNDGGKKVTDIMEAMKTKTGATSDALDQMKNTAVNMNQVIKNQLNGTMIELGNVLLPPVNNALRNMLGILDGLTGKTAQWRSETAAATVDFLSGAGKLIPEAADKVRKSLETIVTGGVAAAGSIRGIEIAIRRHLGDRTAAELLVVEKGLEALIRSGARSQDEMNRLQGSLDLVKTAIGNLPEKPVVAPVPKATTDSIKGTGDAFKLTGEEAEKAADKAKRAAREQGESRRELLDIEIEMTGATITLARLQRIQIEQLELQFQQRIEKLRGQDLKKGLAFLEEAKKRLTEKWAEIFEILDEEVTPSLKDTERVTGRLVNTQIDLRKVTSSATVALAGENAELDRNREKAEKVRAEIARVSFETADAADQFLAMGRALGIADEAFENLAKGIADVAEGIGRVASGDVLGGITAGVSGIASIGKLFFGESESSRRVRLELEKLRDKLEDHRRTLGDLIDVTAPGGKVAKFEEVIGAFLTTRQSGLLGTGFGLGKTAEQGLAGELAKAGLSLRELEEFAKDMGVDLRAGGELINREILASFLAMLQNLDAGFAETFEGQRDRIRQRQQISGGVTPQQELADLIKLVTGSVGSPALGRVLGNADLNSAEGRQRLIDELLSLLEADLPKGELGGLNLQQFRDVLAELADLIRQIGEGPLTEPIDLGNDIITGGEKIGKKQPGIEEFTDGLVPALAGAGFDDLIGLETEAVGYLSKIAASLTRPAPLNAPSAPSFSNLQGNQGGGGGSRSVSVTIASGAIVIQGGATADLPDRLAASIINRALAIEFQEEQVAQGNPVVTPRPGGIVSGGGLVF